MPDVCPVSRVFYQCHEESIGIEVWRFDTPNNYDFSYDTPCINHIDRYILQLFIMLDFNDFHLYILTNNIVNSNGLLR